MVPSLSNPKPIRGNSVWYANSFSSPADYTLRLPDTALQELRAASQTDKFANTPLTDLQSTDFEFGALREALKDLQTSLGVDGRGFVVLDGIDANYYSVDQMEKLYWLIGHCLGTPLSQSAAGDFMGYVQDESKPGEPQPARSYKARRALNMHTDSGDMMGLMCIRQAKSGGKSVISSAHSIYNDVIKEAPELLPILDRGFRAHRRGEQKDGAPEITPYYIPALGHLRGTVLSHYVRVTIDLAARDGEPLDEKELEALNTFDKFAGSRKNLFEFTLSPGQIFFANNYTTLHARSEFEDHEEPEKKRLLLRLWLDAKPEWNMPAELKLFENEGGRGGVDAKENGQRASNAYVLETLVSNRT